MRVSQLRQRDRNDRTGDLQRVATNLQRFAANRADHPHRRAFCEITQGILRTAHDEAARTLTEQLCAQLSRGRGAQVDLRSERSCEATLGKRHRQAALGDVVRARQSPLPDGVSDASCVGANGLEVELWKSVPGAALAKLLKARGRE